MDRVWSSWKQKEKSFLKPTKRSMSWGWIGMWLLFGASLSGCPKPVEPLSEALFRLSTTQKAAGCSDATPNVPCRWDIEGAVDSLAVVSAGEDPIPSCTSCQFNQRIGFIDNTGARHDLYYRLPGDDNAALTQGTPIRMIYLDASKLGQGYAMLLLHKDGTLLFAVTSGAGGTLLANESFGQFQIKEDTTKETGTQADTCGTKVYRDLLFETATQSYRLSPGQVMEILDDQKNRYRAATINRFNWRGSTCPTEQTPFAYYILRLAQ
ncbi:MAG: hypothetical protein H6728_03535 [Myxococcales bacterium]|nr:hypothetical protein [Myxococcales bacterium]